MKNEVVVERLDTLIKQNKEDHEEIIKHQKLTNHKVFINTKWRYSFVAAGVVVTGAVIPLVLYIAMSLQSHVDEMGEQLNKIEVAKY